MHAALRLTFWVVCLVTGAGLSLLCARFTLASFGAYEVDEKVNAWYEKGYIQDFKEWETAIELSERAEQLDPLNPRHKRSRYILFDWRAYTQRLNIDYKKQNQILALDAIENWLRVSKSAGYAWATKFEQRANLGWYDRETMQAFIHAHTLEPWEDLTRKKLIQVAIKHWVHWPENIQQRAKVLIQNSFLIDTTLQDIPVDKYIFNVSIDNEWENDLRALLTREDLRARFERHVKSRTSGRF